MCTLRTDVHKLRLHQMMWRSKWHELGWNNYNEITIVNVMIGFMMVRSSAAVVVDDALLAMKSHSRFELIMMIMLLMIWRWMHCNSEQCNDMIRFMYPCRGHTR